MKMKIWIILICVFASGCSSLIPPGPTRLASISTFTPSPDPIIPSATMQITPSVKESSATNTQPTTAAPALYTLKPVQQNSSTRYYIVELLLDYDLKKFNLIENIYYIYDGTFPTNSLSLIIEPNRYGSGIVINQLEEKSRGYLPRYTLQGNLLIVELLDRIYPGDSIDLLLDYSAVIPEITKSPKYDYPQVYGYTDHQVNLMDFYAFVPAVDGNGNWMTPNRGEFGEHLVYPVFDLGIIIRIASNQNKNLNFTNFFKNYTKLRSFAVSFSSTFTSQTIEQGRNAFSSFYFPEEERAGIDALGYMVEAFDLYTRLFGQIKNQNMSVVEAEFSDGMEFSNLFLLSKDFFTTYNGTPNSFLTTLVAHETAHQWWFGAVGNDQAIDPWLDEALCTYSEKLFYEFLYPDSLDWWWTYRVNYYSPTGKINLPVSDYSNFLEYRNAVYLNGALFLENLRSHLGDQDFFDLLRTYHTRYTDKIASSQDFIKLVKEFDNSEALEELLDMYFQNPDKTQ